MKQTVTESQFVESFRHAGRESQFSRAALFALFEYLEEYESSTGEEIELDPVAICCDFSEYENAREAAAEYDFEPEDEEEDSREESALRWLQNRTQVIEFSDGIVIQNF